MLPKEKSKSIILKKYEISMKEVTYEILCEEDELKPLFYSIIHEPLPIEIGDDTTSLRTIDQFKEEKQQIMDGLNELKANFDDTEERQIRLVQLKNKLCILREKLSFAQNGLLRCMNMLLDALNNTRSELLKKEQLNSIESVLQVIHERTDDFEASLAQEVLIRSGLKPIPNLEGISDLY